jgi:hypothetical protein
MNKTIELKCVDCDDDSLFCKTRQLNEKKEIYMACYSRELDNEIGIVLDKYKAEQLIEFLKEFINE